MSEIDALLHEDRSFPPSEAWTRDVTLHSMLHTNLGKLMEGFRHDAHPMGMFISTVGALSTFYPDAKDIFSPESRRLQTVRLIAKVPSIAAYAFRHSIGRPFNQPTAAGRPQFGQTSQVTRSLSSICRLPIPRAGRGREGTRPPFRAEPLGLCRL